MGLMESCPSGFLRATLAQQHLLDGLALELQWLDHESHEKRVLVAVVPTEFLLALLWQLLWVAKVSPSIRPLW